MIIEIINNELYTYFPTVLADLISSHLIEKTEYGVKINNKREGKWDLSSTTDVWKSGNYVRGKKHGVWVAKNGTIKHYRYGKLHRAKGPAVIYPNGNVKCYRRGKLHSQGDEPAAILLWEDKIELIWYWQDKKHRQGDKPARIFMYKTGEIIEEEYYLYGLKHRLNNKPAHILRTLDQITREWWLYGQRHRTNGPAYEQISFNHSERQWWIKNKLHRKGKPALVITKHRLSCYGFTGKKYYIPGIKFCKEAIIKARCKHNTVEVMKKWYTKNFLHNTRGRPSYVTADVKAWYYYNKLHNTLGNPAVEVRPIKNILHWIDVYFHKGQRHNEVGPSLIKGDGYQQWHVYGRRYYNYTPFKQPTFYPVSSCPITYPETRDDLIHIINLQYARTIDGIRLALHNIETSFVVRWFDTPPDKSKKYGMWPYDTYLYGIELYSIPTLTSGIYDL